MRRDKGFPPSISWVVAPSHVTRMVFFATNVAARKSSFTALFVIFKI